MKTFETDAICMATFETDRDLIAGLPEKHASSILGLLDGGLPHDEAPSEFRAALALLCARHGDEKDCSGIRRFFCLSCASAQTVPGSVRILLILTCSNRSDPEPHPAEQAKLANTLSYPSPCSLKDLILSGG
jgi:hypothetical protein